jgi:hypothetical protein
MISRLRPRLTYSNAIASLALVVALGGTAAAVVLPRNSVGPKQLKRGAVTSKKIRPKAVTGGKIGPAAVGPGNIGNGAVTAAKLARNSVTNQAIANGVVGTNKLGNGVVTTVKLANGAVTAAKLDDGVAPLLGTLKSGQTLRGVFDVGGIEVARGAVSYQFPLLAAPTVTLLKPGETSANCGGLGGGNQQTPQATPGNLCVYVTGEVGAPAMAVEHNTRLGFGLKTSGAGDVAISGQWAVTAP